MFGRSCKWSADILKEMTKIQQSDKTQSIQHSWSHKDICIRLKLRTTMKEIQWTSLKIHFICVSNWFQVHFGGWETQLKKNSMRGRFTWMFDQIRVTSLISKSWTIANCTLQTAYYSSLKANGEIRKKIFILKLVITEKYYLKVQQALFYIICSKL